MPPSDPSWSRLRRAATGPAAIFAGRCTYAASQFATLVAVGRCCGTGAVGEVVLGLAIAVPLFAFFGGQLRLTLATDGEGRFAFRSVERLGLAGHLAALAIFAAIAFALRQEPDKFATLMGVGLARAAESWSEIAHGRLQRRRELTAIGLSTAARSVLGLAVAVGVLIASDSVGFSYAASAAVGLAISVLVDRKLALGGRSVEAPEKASLQELLGSVFPLAAGAALATFDTQLPRYFVEAFLGSMALGSFGAAHYAALALLTLVIPLTYSWTPALADDVAYGDRSAFERRTKRALGVSVGIAVLAAVVALPGARVLAFAFDDPTLLEGWTFPLIVMAAGVLAPAAVLETALRAARGFRTLSLLQGVSLAVHAGFCFEGLRLFGLEGVAAGMLARSVVYLVLLAIGLRMAKSATFGPMTEVRQRLDLQPPSVTDSTRAAA